MRRRRSRRLRLRADGNVRVLHRSRRELGSVLPADRGEYAAFHTPGRREGSSNPFARWHLGAAPLRDASFSPAAIASPSWAATVCVASWTCAPRQTRARGRIQELFPGGLDAVGWARGGRFVLAGGGTRSGFTTSRADASRRGTGDTPAGSRRRRRSVGVAGRVRWRRRGRRARAQRRRRRGRENAGAGVEVGSGAGSGPGSGSAATIRRRRRRRRPIIATTICATDAPGEVLRFGSVGQDCRLCLWDLDVDDGERRRERRTGRRRRFTGAHATAHAASRARTRAAAVPAPSVAPPPSSSSMLPAG